MKKAIQPKHILFALITLLILVGVSLIQTKYVIRVIDLALIYSITTFGLLLMLGMGGQMVFSCISFMGIGAYATANFCSGRLGFYMDGSLAIVLSMLAGGLVALLFGLPLLRLKGTFFTFATIGIVQILYTFFLNYVPVFGGPAGIAGIETWTVFGIKLDEYIEWFYVLFVIAGIVMLLLQRVRSTQFGRHLAAIRDNEMAAQTLGVNVYWTRVKAFTLSGMLGGLSGALLAMMAQYIAAENFTFNKSSTFVIMAMLGGVNSAPGIVVGSALITFLPEVLRGVDRYLMFIYGIMVILLMILMPMGLAGVLTDFLKKQRRKKKRAKAAAKSTAVEK